MSANDDELVPVMVPRSQLRRVYQALAEGEDGGNSQAGSTSPARDPSERASWPPELIERLVNESPAGALVILEALADRPGEVVGADDFARALRERLPAFGGEPKPDANWNTAAGALGALARRVKNRYGRELPFPSRLDGEGRWAHSMTVEFAELVRPHLDGRRFG